MHVLQLPELSKQNDNNYSMTMPAVSICTLHTASLAHSIATAEMLKDCGLVQARRVTGQVAPEPAALEPPRITGIVIDPVDRDPEVPMPVPQQLQIVAEEVPNDATPAGYDSVWDNIMRSVRAAPVVAVHHLAWLRRLHQLLCHV